MKRIILLAALSTVACSGQKAEYDYENAASNSASHRKLCELAERAADAFDGVDLEKYEKWRGEARHECSLADLDTKTGG